MTFQTWFHLGLCSHYNAFLIIPHDRLILWRSGSSVQSQTIFQGIALNMVEETHLKVRAVSTDMQMIGLQPKCRYIVIFLVTIRTLICGTPTRHILIVTTQWLSVHIVLITKPAKSPKDLGVMFDSNFSLDIDILATVSPCMWGLARTYRARQAFTKDLLVTTVNTLVFSKLFYCSSVCSNTWSGNLPNLHRVQNFASCIVNGTRKFDHLNIFFHDL